MSTLRWNPVYGRLEFELPDQWQSDVTVLMSGPHVMRAIVEFENVANQADTTTTVERIWSSCDGEGDSTKVPSDGGLSTLKGKSIVDPGPPMKVVRTRLCWIIPLYTEGSMCVHPHNPPTTQYIAPADQLMEGTSPTLWHAVTRFVSPEGDTVEIIVVAKDDRVGGDDGKQRKWPRSEYTQRLLKAIRGQGRRPSIDTRRERESEYETSPEAGTAHAVDGVTENGAGRS